MILILFVLLSASRCVNAYFSYSVLSNVNIIPDIIPQWSMSCFDKESYRGKLCNPVNHFPGCIIYVDCPNGVCTTDIIDGYHEFGEYKNVSGIVFSGEYPENGSCLLPSTFISQPWYDFETYVKNNNYAYLALKDPYKEDIRDIIIVHRFGMLFIGIVLFLIVTCSYIQARRQRLEQRLHFMRILPEFQEVQVQTETQQIRIITDSSFNSEDGEATCPICIEPFEEGETVSSLSCGHKYKPQCIRDWLTKETRCPLCNAEK